MRSVDSHAGAAAVASAYNRIAGGYDDRWSRYVEEPQDRLTRGLRLRRGDRVVDFACGTGIDTLKMLKQVAPGEVVAVDSSEAMLNAAVRRAAEAGLPLTARCASAQAFIDTLEDDTFDVVSLRFGLAYVHYATSLPRLGRIVRPGGRVGILTSLAGSAPQAYEVYRRMMSQITLPDAKPDVPSSPGDVSEALAEGGLQPTSEWVHRFRLWFDTGMDAADWLQESGYVTHTALKQFSPPVLKVLIREFARRLDAYREVQGIPLDFSVAGVIATRPES